MTLLEEFSQNLQGKDIDKLVHEAKAESEERILGQGAAFIALFISDVMMKTIAAARRGEYGYPLAEFSPLISQQP